MDLSRGLRGVALVLPLALVARPAVVEAGWLERLGVVLFGGDCGAGAACGVALPARAAASGRPCPDSRHDAGVWHPLVDPETGCHHDHEHKDDPHAVADVFGPPGNAPGIREIAFAWNDEDPLAAARDHAGYGWLVRRGLACESRFADGCLVDFRVQFHAVMSARGASRRFHPFSLEAHGCLESRPERCGTARTAGWADYGHLEVDGRHVPLPGDPPRLGRGGRRIHHLEKGDPHVGTWFGGNLLATVALQTSRMWGRIFPDDPLRLHLFCSDGRCRSNGSVMQAHAIGLRVPEYLDEDGDGLVTYVGYTDRHGEIVDGCTGLGLDCIPLEIVDMPVGEYQYRDDTHDMGEGPDHDSSPPGQAWIRYPN